MLHGQRVDLGGLFLTNGFALDLGPGFAPLVGLAVGLSLSLLAAGGRGGGWLVSGRRCSHGRTLHKRREEGIVGHAPGQFAGEVAVTNHKSYLQTETTDPARNHRSGSPVM